MSAPRSYLLAVSFMLIGAATPAAQFGDLGHSLPNTPEQQEAIDQASNFLSSVGEDLSGITVTNANLAGNVPAAFDPNTNTLGVDFDRLKEVVPPETPGAPGHPGNVVVVMFHELQHARHGWNCDPATQGEAYCFCQEAELTAYVASKHCEFICWIAANGGGPLNALCKQYDHIKDKANDPDQQGKVQEAGCSGNTQIPECGCC